MDDQINTTEKLDPKKPYISDSPLDQKIPAEAQAEYDARMPANAPILQNYEPEIAKVRPCVAGDKDFEPEHPKYLVTYKSGLVVAVPHG